jgi:heat shock protein HslJ
MDDRPLEGIEWRLTHHLGPQGELVPIVEDVMATATFIDGSVAGSTGCNRYHAPYCVDEDRLKIELIAMTMMACDPERSAVESAFTSALGAAVTCAIAGARLDLVDADGRVVLRLRAVPALVLRGSRWIATMINNGRGGVAGLLEGTVVTAEFGTDGRVAGSGGCNQFSGGYTLEGDGLAIGPVASTRKAYLAPEGAGEQEAAYLAALARVTTWSFREERLQLRAADGALQVEFRPAAWLSRPMGALVDLDDPEELLRALDTS